MDVHDDHDDRLANPDHHDHQYHHDHTYGSPQPITAGQLRLQVFDVDAPTLTTADGAVYIPIRWLCDLLGLAPAVWIGLVCARYQSDREHHRASENETPTASGIDVFHGGNGEAQVEGQAIRAHKLRRLPWSRSDRLADSLAGPARLEWCLEWERVTQWLAFDLNSRRVPEGPRRDQVRALRDKIIVAAASVYDRKQVEFHATKREIIDALHATQQTLSALERLDAMVGPHIEHSAATPAQGQGDRQAFAALVAEGSARHLALAAALRTALQEMLNIPIIEGYRVDEDGYARESESMPIVPFIPDLRQVERLSDEVVTWQQHDLFDWLDAHGFRFTPTADTGPSPESPASPGSPEFPDDGAADGSGK